MHRFYLPSKNCRSEVLTLEEREAHHALHVLRLKRGDRVTVLDGVGHEIRCDVESAAKNLLSLTVKEKILHAAPACPVSLFVAIPKGRIIEDIIEKAVELGAQRIVPLLTVRVVTQLDQEEAELKRIKWQQVAVEAIKQCGAPWLPKVEPPVTLKNYLAAGNLPELSLVGSLQTERRLPGVWLQEFRRQHGRLPHSAGIWIGPEGDFTLAELQAIEAAGAKPVTLGPLTLRVETAAISLLAVLQHGLAAD